MQKRFKLLLVAAVAGMVTGYSYKSSEAAFIVIDPQNIAQQLKTYEETAKVATATAQHLSLMVKEVASLPRDILNSYTTAITGSTNAINGSMEGFTVYSMNQRPQDSIDTYWKNQFPKFMESDHDISEDVFHQRNNAMCEARSQGNRQTMQAYKELMHQLNQSQDTLHALLRENNQADGGLKAQQIANHIAGVEANIKQIELNMQALQVKHQVEKDEADVTRKLNQEILNARNAAEITDYISTLDSTGTWKAVRNPWKDNGVSTLGW